MLCDCCKRDVDYVRRSAWHGSARICRECFAQWYDPDNSSFDACDPVQIGNYVRSKHGLPPTAEACGGSGLAAAMTKTMPEQQPDSAVVQTWFTLKEAADYLRRGMTWMNARVTSGEIPARRVGRDILIKRDHLDAFVESCPDARLTCGPSPRTRGVLT